jgi:hypothetical protein
MNQTFYPVEEKQFLFPITYCVHLRTSPLLWLQLLCRCCALGRRICRRLLAGRSQNGHILDSIQLFSLQFKFNDNSQDLDNMLMQFLLLVL